MSSAAACLQDGAIGPRIDDEQQVSLFDHAAFVEVDRLQVAADARAHLDGLDGLDAARVFVPVRDALRQRMRHRDDGGGRCHSTGSAPQAASDAIAIVAATRIAHVGEIRSTRGPVLRRRRSFVRMVASRVEPRMRIHPCRGRRCPVL